MSRAILKIGRGDARQLWALLAAEGKAPAELGFAGQVLPTYSVRIGPWLERISKTYLQDLSRQHAHFKLIIAPYGGGKTHFLMSLGNSALQEGFGVAYIACTQGLAIDSPLDVYRACVKTLSLPGGGSLPGLGCLLDRTIKHKFTQIQRACAPDPVVAFSAWLDGLASEEYPESAFGRVSAAALRHRHNPEQVGIGDAGLRWLRGDIDTLTKDELTALRIAKVSGKGPRSELGRNLLLSLIRFAKAHAGVEGVVILFDEVETMFTATGKALQRVLSAMRVMVDLPASVPGGVPLLGVFSAVPDVLEQLAKYPAIEQRFAVRGAAFDEGSDFAVQVPLERLGRQRDLLRELGTRLVDIGELATGYVFERSIQAHNIGRLAEVAEQRSLQIDARRLFVKACVGILDLQAKEGEREIGDDELAGRYSGSFESLRRSEDPEPEP